MLKLSQPITSINGFKIGDRVRLIDGDGRPHIIKSFSIDGMKEFFFEVQFKDGTEAMLDNIAPLPSNLDEAAETYAENILANGEDMFDAIADGFRAGAEWREQQIPKLPDNLDEAAEEIASDIAPTHPDIDWDECFEKIKDGIKAGAEWMAGQGETIDGEILTTSDYGWETIRIPKKLYPLGTKVTIQIRKKQ